jgi:hypothetical protein
MRLLEEMSTLAPSGRLKYGRPPEKAFPAALEVEALEIGPELVREVGARQRELHGRLDFSPVSCRLPSNSTA